MQLRVRWPGSGAGTHGWGHAPSQERPFWREELESGQEQIPSSPTMHLALGTRDETRPFQNPGRWEASSAYVYKAPTVLVSVPAGGKHTKALPLGASWRSGGKPWLRSLLCEDRTRLQESGSERLHPAQGTCQKGWGQACWGRGGNRDPEAPEGGGWVGGSPSWLLGVLMLAIRLQGRVDLLPQCLHLRRV